MDVKINLPKTKCSDWNELFSQKYHSMLRVSDIDSWGLQDKSMQQIKKQIKARHEMQSLELDETQFVVPEKKTLAVRGLGYWVGSLQWDRKNDNSQNTVITGKISNYWLAAPIAVAGLALGVWYFKDIFGFLNPVGLYPAAFVITSLIVVALIGLLNYFVHMHAIKNMMKQLTVFLKYKGVSYEYGEEVYDAEKAFEEARIEYEKQLRETQQQIIESSQQFVSTDSVTTDYIQSSVAVAEEHDVLEAPPEDTNEISVDLITQDFEAGVEEEAELSEEFAVAEEVDEGTDEFTQVLEGFNDESAILMPEAEDFTEEFDIAVPSVQESGDEIIIEDVDIVVPDIEEEDSNHETLEDEEQQSEVVKLMSDGLLQTSEMKGLDDYESEIGGIDIDDSAYELGRSEDFDDEESEEYIDDPDATQIDSFVDDILSPDDAFAQGFSPAVSPDDIESEESILEDDFNEEIEIEDEEFDQSMTEEQPEEEHEIDDSVFDMDDNYEVDQDALTEISEMTDSFAVPEIAEGYSSSTSVDEPEIPDEFMTSEITQDMGLKDEDIDMSAAQDESEIFDIPEVDIPEEDDAQEVEISNEEDLIPDDFMVPEIEEEDGDGFEGATEYVVDEFANEDNVTNIESYGDGFLDEQDDDAEDDSEEQSQFEETDEDFENTDEKDIAEIEAAIEAEAAFNVDVPSFDDEQQDEATFSEADFSKPGETEEDQDDEFGTPEEEIDQTDFFNDIDVPEIEEEDLTENDIIVPEIEIEEDDDEDEDWANDWQ